MPLPHAFGNCEILPFKMLRMGSSLSISSRDLHRLYGPVMTCDMCSTCVPMCSHVTKTGSSSFTSDLTQCPSFLDPATSFQLPFYSPGRLCFHAALVQFAGRLSDRMLCPSLGSQLQRSLVTWTHARCTTPPSPRTCWSRYQLDAVIALLITKDHHGINMNKPHFRGRVDRKDIAQISVADQN